MLCFKILTTGNKITSNDVSNLLKAGSALDLKSEKSKPTITWMEDKIWLNIINLSRQTFA